MKKLLTIAIPLLLLSLFPKHAFALRPNRINVATNQAEIQNTKRLEIQKRLEEKRLLIEKKREEIRNRIQVRQATRTARLQARNKVRIRTLYGRIEIRLNAAIERLNRLIERIETRLAIYKNNNPDLDFDSIESDIETAKDLLAQASASLEALKTNLEDVLASEDPKQGFAVIRESVKEIKDNLVEAHRLLVHIIGDIKGLRVGNTGVQKDVPKPTEPASVGG